MVLSFFHGPDDPLDQVERQVVEMLGNCRHSFDLAMSALVAAGDIDAIGTEVRDTDEAINAVEETVRRELVVHVAVHGGDDVGAVLGFLLVVKKLERVGDQAKNIFDLAAEGVRFTDAPDRDVFTRYRNTVSELFARTIGAVSSGGEDRRADDLLADCQELMDEFDRSVNQLVHSTEPGAHAVPRAMLHRYLKRIVANLSGTVSTMRTGLERPPDLDD